MITLRHYFSTALMVVLCAIFFASTGNASKGPLVLPIGPDSAVSTPAKEQKDIPDGAAIARWNVVPNQALKNNIDIGVVAFHQSGIDRVEFFANGGKKISVSQKKINQRTLVEEYFVTLPVKGHKDGKIFVQATVYPKSGTKRELFPLLVFANGKGSYTGKTVYASSKAKNKGKGTRDNPFSSIAKAIAGAGSGGTVILIDEGFYSLSGKANIRGVKSWITIRADETLDQDKVILGMKNRKDARFASGRLKFQNVSIEIDSFKQFYPEKTQFMWFDQVRWFGTGKNVKGVLNPVRTSKYIGGYYVTRSIAEDLVYGFVDALLVRNSLLKRIQGDALQNSRMVLNVRVDDMDGNISAHHSDILQYFGHFENIIVNGVIATRITDVQNLFFDHYKSSFRNMAFVNLAFENLSANPPFSQMSSSHSHVMFENISMIGQNWVFRDDQPGEKQFQARHVLFRNNILTKLNRAKHGWLGVPKGVGVVDTHFISGEGHGKNATQGKVSFRKLGPDEVTYNGVPARDNQPVKGAYGFAY